MNYVITCCYSVFPSHPKARYMKIVCCPLYHQSNLEVQQFSGVTYKRFRVDEIVLGAMISQNKGKSKDYLVNFISDVNGYCFVFKKPSEHISMWRPF